MWRRAAQGTAQTALLAGLSLLLTARYAWVHAHHPLGPDSDLPATAWFGWADQGNYLRAARAWVAGNLDPSQHVYPAGYALLGAPFVRLTPLQPFYVPDLLCWLVSLWLFAALSARLWRGVPGMHAVGGLVFFLVTVAEPRAFYTWEVPWTSTPAAALTFASLLLAVRHAEERRPVLGLGAALFAGLVVLFRPTDALVVIGLVGLALLAAQRGRPACPGAAAGFLALAGCAVAVGPVLLVATHVVTHGWVLGYYFAYSREVGFEPRLLPLRWVTLLLNPKPLAPDGEGLAQAYPFMLPGLAGILAAVLGDRGRRGRHLLVGGGAIGFLCLYLCYRDLQVSGLFLFGNQHYFKWTLPVFALYALALPWLVLARRRLAAGGAAVAVVALLSCWRAQLATVPADPAPSVMPDGRGLLLPHGFGGLDGAVAAASPDDFLTLYFGHHTLDEAGRQYRSDTAFKLVPVPSGFVAVPLRPLGTTPAVLRLADPLRLDPAEPVRSLRQAIVFGLPCAILPQRPACRFPDLLHATR